MVNVPNKKYLKQKDGFECANDMSDRQLERLMDLKLTSTLRERERRKSRPQFVIKPLDQREFLKIQLQYVETAQSDAKAKSKKSSMAAIDLRRSLDSSPNAPRRHTRMQEAAIPRLSDTHDVGLTSPTDFYKSTLPGGMMSPDPKRSLSMNHNNISPRGARGN